MDVAAISTRMRKGTITSLTDLPEYIVTTFVPGARPLLERYPRLFRVLGILVAFYYFGPINRLQSLWNEFSTLLVSSIKVSSDEDLFNYLTTFLAKKRAMRPNQSLNAITNPLQENRRNRHDPDYEETAQRTTKRPAQVTYEQGQGMQIFVHNKRLYWVVREDGEGHSYYGNRYKRQEVFKFYCLGRSTQPIKDLLEDIYKQHKEGEKSLTVIRRPYGSGYGSRLTWSRLTAKRRRQLDTVILQESQTATILADVEEYMSEATKAFYANHGIPYRRGYLFHGPPGCGKTSFCLALASKFNLDVYILTLLDKDLNDTDLMSLLNQLPTPSLLLLEDVDEAGLNRKSKAAAGAARKKQRGNFPEGAIVTEDDFESDEEDSRPNTRVTLSGLLNAIDGVAAPEGHILIMTTNKPNELDEALVRAGRISVHVQFSNANTKQAEKIFQRMYVDINEPLLEQTPVEAKKSGTSEDELAKLASEFASVLPSGEFSPADLQDYLLVYKKDPQAAVINLKAWIQERRDERKRKEEDKEMEIQWKVGKAEDRRRKWREDLKKAFKEGGQDGAEGLMMEKEKEIKDKEKEERRESSDSD